MSEQEQQLRMRGLAVLDRVGADTRVVVRFHDGDGASDALGELIARSPAAWTVRTRRGDVVVPRDALIAARPVPPPPIRATR